MSENDVNGDIPKSGGIANIVALSLAHFSCDAHLNFLPPLWPIIKALYGLSNTGIGLLTALLSITANFGQVFFGYITDRLRPPRLALIGVLMTTGFISTIGFMPSLFGLVFSLLMAGVGIALFHPRAAALAAGWRRGQAAFGLGIFGASGTLGYATGSLIGVSLYQHFGGLKGLLPSLGFGLGVAVAVAIINPEDNKGQAKTIFKLRQHLLPRIGRLAPIFTVIVLRTAAVTVFVNFMPLLLKTRGASLSAGGGAVFLFVAGTSIGSIVGGRLASVVEERRLTATTLFLASPLLLISVITGGVATFVCLFLAGFMLRCADYVNIAQAQAIVPEGASIAAAIGMGATWGIAGLVAPLVGRLADMYGEVYALAWSAGLPVAGALIALASVIREGKEEV
jgi:FSR family fosmidomycin resistance protein-like MFS transporter